MFDFDDNGLLHEIQDGKTVFTWTYSVFEEYACESISPSMYDFMASYVFNRICFGAYPMNLEAEAVEAYYALDRIEKERLRTEKVIFLDAKKKLADSKVSSAIDALLDENRPFDETSPISREYVGFMRGLVEKYSLEAHMLTDQIEEELKH